MNDHQTRLWSSMIDRVDEYLIRGAGFAELVGMLEGALQAGEFKEELERQFYDYWTPLEVVRALIADREITQIEAEAAVQTDVIRLRDFLCDMIDGTNA